jgi:Reverse transcriptase (RNA-dependent DNA polymerase)
VAICFDQAKAFDRLDHGYLLYVLNKMGFGPTFIHWVSILYTDIYNYSCVLVNGFLTSPFPVTRSVRQGCGFSPLLYALCIQPLSILIRQHLPFRGIRTSTYASTFRSTHIYVCGRHYTVLASDTSSVNIAIEYFDTFCRASGARFNLAKCEARIFSGLPDLSEWPSRLKIVDTVKICGVYFGANASLMIENKLKEKITASFKTLKSRHLTILGKVTLINTLILAKLWYTATCTILNDPFFRWLDGVIFSFIWTSKEKVSRATLILP